MNKLSHVTFAPKDPDRHKILNQKITAGEISEEEEVDWIVIWRGVRVADKEMAISIIKKEGDMSSHLKVNPKFLTFVAEQLRKKDNWWVRFKKWVLTFIPFRR